jgi:isocitrate/isopropylmalate dehydrogenase
MMLRHLGKHEVLERIRGGLYDTIVTCRVFTRDLGGSATTSEFTDQVIRSIESGAVRPAV